MHPPNRNVRSDAKQPQLTGLAVPEPMKNLLSNPPPFECLPSWHGLAAGVPQFVLLTITGGAAGGAGRLDGGRTGTGDMPGGAVGAGGVPGTGIGGAVWAVATAAQPIRAATAPSKRIRMWLTPLSVELVAVIRIRLLLHRSVWVAATVESTPRRLIV